MSIHTTRAREVTLIYVQTFDGTGTDEDPVRKVESYFRKDGALVLRLDRKTMPACICTHAAMKHENGGSEPCTECDCRSYQAKVAE